MAGKFVQALMTVAHEDWQQGNKLGLTRKFYQVYSIDLTRNAEQEG